MPVQRMKCSHENFAVTGVHHWEKFVRTVAQAAEQSHGITDFADF